MASWAELEAVTVCPALSKMAHFKVTTCGSSSIQRIRAMRTGSSSLVDTLYDAQKGAVDKVPPKRQGLGWPPILEEAHPSCQIQPCLALLAYRFRLREQQKVSRPPGFRVGPRHVESAE